MATKKRNAAPAASHAARKAVGGMANEAATKAFKGYDELVAAGKDNLDAVVRANTAATAGMTRLNSQVAANMKAAYEANLAFAKALSGVKTVNEAVELQAGHVRASLDMAITNGTELSEIALKAANDVAEPLQARTKFAIDTLLTPAAA
ncbi:MAG: TIGR01841 family phasin [Kiloniellales bacterium]|nr:TIGR01841 family phasin [Kiloniellales bacterium]